MAKIRRVPSAWFGRSLALPGDQVSGVGRVPRAYATRSISLLTAGHSGGWATPSSLHGLFGIGSVTQSQVDLRDAGGERPRDSSCPAAMIARRSLC